MKGLAKGQKLQKGNELPSLSPSQIYFMIHDVSVQPTIPYLGFKSLASYSQVGDCFGSSWESSGSGKQEMLSLEGQNFQTA